MTTLLPDGAVTPSQLFLQDNLATPMGPGVRAPEPLNNSPLTQLS